MSMLADWFFCTTVDLSPGDTHAVLDTLAVIRRRPSSPDELRDAACALLGAPAWVQLYGLHPLLTAYGRLCDEGDAKGRDESGVDEASASRDPDLELRLLELVDAIIDSTEHPASPALRSAVEAVVHDDAGARADVVAASATLTAPAAAPSASRATPYHDLGDEALPTLAVVALAELTRRRPASAADLWLADEAVPLCAAALRGEHGRLALLVAVEAATRTDPRARDHLWRTLWHEGRGAAALQPDLLDALARTWFGRPDGDDAPSVAVLEAEAVTGEDLALWAASAGRGGDAALADAYSQIAGQVPGGAGVMTAVLWHIVLWSLAVEADPVEAARRTARWWGIPRPPGEGPARIAAGGSLAATRRFLQDVPRLRPAPEKLELLEEPVEGTAAADGAAVWSPWWSRWHDGWDHERRGGPAFNAGQAGTTAALVRLLGSTVVAASILESTPTVGPEEDHLTALLFHTADVLRDHGSLISQVRDGRYVGDGPLGPAVVSLIWHVHRLVQDIGCGQADRVAPHDLAAFAARFLTDESSLDLADVHRARFARQAVGAVTTSWIRGAWAQSSAVSGNDGCNRWFEGDPPHARQALVLALDRQCRIEEIRRATRPGKKVRVPEPWPIAQLLKEIYPAQWPEPHANRWTPVVYDWNRPKNPLAPHYEAALRRAGGDPEAVAENVIKPERLLLSPRHPLAVWEAASPDLERWLRVDSGPLTMRVLRLSALLEDPRALASDDHREWVQDWLDRLYAVSRSDHLPLAVRSRMIELITPPLLDGADPVAVGGVLADVHRATIDTLLEFAVGTPRHVEALLERLAGPVLPGVESTDQLRLRAMETIHRRRGRTSDSTVLAGPADRRRRRIAASSFEVAVLRLIAAVASTPTAGDDRRSWAERSRESWERSQRTPSERALRRPLGRPTVEPRAQDDVHVPDVLVAATAIDRHRAQRIHYHLDLDPERREDGRRVHSLFPNEGYRQRLVEQAAGAPRTVVAVVAAVEDDRFWVNAGTGALLPRRRRGHRAPAVGDVIAVELRGEPLEIVDHRDLARRSPEPDEVRFAWVAAVEDTPWLSVSVEGLAVPDVYPRQPGAAGDECRRLWDPDLARGHGDAPFGELAVPARWDADLSHWVPVQRSLAELLVDEPDIRTQVDLVHAGDDLFVTVPGRLYHLRDADWESPDATTEALRGQPAGTVLSVVLTDEVGGDVDDIPRLRLLGHDDRNVRWRRLFDDVENEPVVAARGADGTLRIEVDAPPGFPSSVTVHGAEESGSRVIVLPEQWDDLGARTASVGTVGLQTIGVPDPEHPTPERFAELVTIERGDRVVLSQLLSQRRIESHVLVRTRAGLVARLETESLSLLDPEAVDRRAPALVEGRVAEVVSVTTRTEPDPPGRPIGVDDLVERVATDGDRSTLRRVLGSAPSVTGVVVTRTTVGDGSMLYGVWCEVGGRVQLVHLEGACFSADRPQPIGQPVHGQRDGAAWSFRFARRSVVVRAVFTLEEGDRPAASEFVGVDGRDGLYQDPARPVVWRGPLPGGDPVAALRLVGARVTALGRLRPGTRPVSVTAPRGGRTLLGGALVPESSAGVVVTGLRVWVNETPGEGVHLRRVFHVRTSTATTVPRGPARPDHALRWERFLASGERHVTGRLVARELKLNLGLWVPCPDGVLRDRVPVAEDDAPAVHGVSYPVANVRAALVPRGAGYVASYASAEPLDLGSFMALLQCPVADGSRRTLTDVLRYVGPPTDGVDGHVFEWGFGWSVTVPRDRMIVVGGPEERVLPPLFHGDRVGEVRFRTGDDGLPVLEIEWRAIVHDFVTQIVEEGRQDQLHLVDIELQLDTGSARVLHAQTRSPRAVARPFQGAQWVPLAASLDGPSVAALIDGLRAHGDTGLVRRRILARFDVDRAVATGGRERRFRPVRVGEGDLQPHDRVFLVARDVERRRNETTVIFGLPADAMDAGALTVRVNRRQFSFRENTLARLLDSGLDVETGGVLMLVRLMSEDRGVWTGSTRDAPPRRPEALVGHLTHRGGSGYAIVGRVGGASRLEIAPGIVFDGRGVVGAEDTATGAIVRLALDRRHSTVELVVAIPADTSYLGAEGRPAVVFPKSTLLGRDDRQRSGPMRGGFTPSGLPGVELTPDEGAGTTLLGLPHPKVGVVARTPEGAPRVRLPESGEARRGRLAFSAKVAERAPVLESGEAGGTRVPWSRMSFRDASARDVLHDSTRFAWQHHDRSTGRVLADGRVQWNDVGLGSLEGDGAFFDDDEGLTLRFPPESLGRFGFPAGELLDEPGWRRRLPVAGPSADGGGVWVELGPGRVVEIRGPLVTADGHSSLADLDWSAFRPGDEIGCVPAEEPGAGREWNAGPGHLVLTSWRSTVRAALPLGDRSVPVLLPVRGADHERGALQLGARRWALTVPIDGDRLAGLADEVAVWLDGRNDTHPLSGRAVAAGDVVLLTVDDDGELRIDGLGELGVRLAPDAVQDWPGSKWLHAALADPGRRPELMAALGRLPVTVHGVGVDGTWVSVSRRHQPPGHWPAGRLVRTEVVAAWGRGSLLLAHGGALYDVPVRAAVAGLPGSLAAAAAARLPAGTELWWVVDADRRRHPGRSLSDPAVDGRDVSVRPLYEVVVDDEVAGIICSDGASGRLAWLPAEQASWSDRLPVRGTPAALAPLGEVLVHEASTGELSIIGRSAVDHHATRLRLGDTLRVIVGARSGQTDDGRWRYVARLRVPAVALTFVSADSGIAEGATRLTEIDELGVRPRFTVTVVDLNSRLVPLALPSSLVAAHRSIAAGSPRPSADTAYHRWFVEGVVATSPAHDPVEDLVRWAGTLTEGPPPEPTRLLACVDRWLAEDGSALLGLQRDRELDAAPALAALIVLDAAGRADPARRPDAVLALRQVGARAAASLHTAAFAGEWVGRPERHGLSGAWARLRALDLDAELTPRQVRGVREFCRAILTKPGLRLVENGLAPVARSLLAAIGELETVEAMTEAGGPLVELAGWGRASVAPAGLATAQPELLPSQRCALETLAETVIGSAVPWVLLPPDAPLRRDERDLATEIVARARANVPTPPQPRSEAPVGLIRLVQR
ncbi:hypothetical protein [Actinomycetospora aeridis]|uniref:DNA-binding protein n=1 Tax=Actinomycetospora aeridis TaxID=3129231 RepID=A0ABU8N6G2_9PSEU